LIFDVSDTRVWIADPNIPNPHETIRVLTHDEFYEKWWEKSPQGYKVRRPAMAIMPEITSDGRQIVASSPQMEIEGRWVYVDEAFAKALQKTDPARILKNSPLGGFTWMTKEDPDGDFAFSPRKNRRTNEFVPGWYVVSYAPGHLITLQQMAEKILRARITRLASDKVSKSPTPVTQKKKNNNIIHVPPSKPRSEPAQELLQLQRGGGSGKHKNPKEDFEKGRSRKPKHKQDWSDKDAVEKLANRYTEKNA
jgi:hypothetical protein